MKVLWVTNGLLPEALDKLSQCNELRGSGGWILGLSELLSKADGIQLYIAGISSSVKCLTVVNGKFITFYAIPRKGASHRYHHEYEAFFRIIAEEIEPDIVHIQGTEYPYSLAAFKSFGPDKTVISLQGIVSVIAPYYLGGIPKFDALRNITIHDIIRPNLLRQQNQMKKRGKYEIQLLKESRFVIGRTSWDRAHTWALNPSAKYFHCDEVFRQEFYTSQIWDYSRCVPHSIFVSQSYYPLKGLHLLIDAMGIVSQHFPDVQLRIAGSDFTYEGSKWMDKFHLSSYGRIIKKKVANNHLHGHVMFTGQLNAWQMIQEYLRCNVFVCSSCIENSPNSLGEAQMLGVPTLASYVGGVPDMMIGSEECIYRFEEVEMLAEKICAIFRQDLLHNIAIARSYALQRHDQDKVLRTLLEIYRSISKLKD